jgi:hypothetical protein
MDKRGTVAGCGGTGLVNIRDYYTGCILEDAPDTPPAGSLAAPPPYAPMYAASEGVDWLRWVNPSDDQGDDTSCVLRAYAGHAEAIARRAGVFPRGRQISVRRAYDRVMYGLYSGIDRGGMTLADGLYGSLGEGILPPGTRLHYARELSGVRSLLRHGPPLIAMQVTRGWWRVARNGWTDPLADRTVIGAHCMLLVAILEDRGEPYILVQDWQGPELGWHGCRVFHWSAFELFSDRRGACLPVRPPGTEGWLGWGELLTDAPDGGQS